MNIELLRAALPDLLRAIGVTLGTFLVAQAMDRVVRLHEGTLT